MKPQSRIIVTGASGFIGSHLVPKLEESGFEVHRLSRSASGLPREYICDLADQTVLGRIFAEIKPDFVLHLASLAQPTRELDDLELQIQNTIVPTISLAKTIPASVKLALFFGSCEEYGNGPVPFQENQALRNISPYGWAKISAFHATTLIASQRELPYCWLRPFLTFGPRQKTKQLVPQLIEKCLNGEEVQLSPGEQTRDFIYIEDLISMIVAIMREPEKALGQTINLCTQKPVSVKKMAQLIRDICGSGKLNFGAFPYRHNEAMSFYGSNQKFSELFGSPNFTPLETALNMTVAAYRNAK